MTTHYDREGKAITTEEWAALWEDKDYQQVLQTHLPDGTHISTVWLGIDHNYGSGPPIIFETMIFSPDEEQDEQQWRYATEAEARRGHWHAVATQLPLSWILFDAVT